MLKSKLDDLSDLSLGIEDEPILLLDPLLSRELLIGEDEPMPSFNPLPDVSKLSVKQYATLPVANCTPRTCRGDRSKLYRAEQAKRREQIHEKDIVRGRLSLR